MDSIHLFVPIEDFDPVIAPLMLVFPGERNSHLLARAIAYFDAQNG